MRGCRGVYLQTRTQQTQGGIRERVQILVDAVVSSPPQKKRPGGGMTKAISGDDYFFFTLWESTSDFNSRASKKEYIRSICKMMLWRMPPNKKPANLKGD
mmetsp:Transcript_18312/g.22714  ORF Transcript_18312/g.22714 Transcript_18312/m.22714 type:complete len:100 (-) Transcript_18312:44-343(-)